MCFSLLSHDNVEPECGCSNLFLNNNKKKNKLQILTIVILLLFYLCRWASRRYSVSRREWSRSTVCGDAATRVSREHSTAATSSWRACAVCRWLCAGDASSLASPSHTSGTTHRCFASWAFTSSTSASLCRSCSASASARAARPAASCSARSSSKTNRKAPSHRSAVARSDSSRRTFCRELSRVNYLRRPALCTHMVFSEDEQLNKLCVSSILLAVCHINSIVSIYSESS